MGADDGSTFFGGASEPEPSPAPAPLAGEPPITAQPWQPDYYAYDQYQAYAGSYAQQPEAYMPEAYMQAYASAQGQEQSAWGPDYGYSAASTQAGREA